MAVVVKLGSLSLPLSSSQSSYMSRSLHALVLPLVTVHVLVFVLALAFVGDGDCGDRGTHVVVVF